MRPARADFGHPLTYADAAMIVAAERGPRPIVRVPSSFSYPGKSNAAILDEQRRMFDGITAREDWDRAVKRLLADPVHAAVTDIHRIAGGSPSPTHLTAGGLNG